MIKTEDAPPASGHNMLRSFVGRFENLEAQRRALKEDSDELLKEVEGSGFDKGAFKMLIKMRSETAEARKKRLDKQHHFETYSAAIGED